MAQVQEIWNKFNARERLIGTGAIVIVVGWLIALIGSYGFGGNTVAVIGAIAVLVILYLKYAPNSNVTWPAPIPTINLVISGIVALLALISLLQWLGIGGFGGFGLAVVGALVTAVGAAIMVWGAWQEYQLTSGTAGSSTSSTTSAPPAAPPPAAPPTTPSDTDDLPPA